MHTLDRLTTEQVIDALPHGSGIDAAWEAEEIEDGMTRAEFSCSYHGMNEGGMYGGWVDFQVILFVHQEDVTAGPRSSSETYLRHRAGDIDFELVMSTDGDDDRDFICGLDEYLGETIQYALSEAKVID